MTLQELLRGKCFRLAVLICCVAWSSPSARGADGTNAAALLAQVEAKMGEVRTVQASFTQEKNLSLFDQKITLEGRLYIENPGRFAWFTSRPVRYALVMNGNDVRQWDEDSGKVQKIPVAKNPMFKMAMGQMRDWFAGRYGALRGEYDVTVVSRTPCVLRFTPKPGAVTAKALRAVQVSLQTDLRYLDSVQIEDLNGDSTIIRFSQTILNEPIAARAWEVQPPE